MANPKRKISRNLPKANISEIEVDNPHYQPANDGQAGNPKKIKAFVNTRSSLPVFWSSNINPKTGQTYISESAYQAFLLFDQDYSRSQIGGAGAIDYSKVRVDTSGPVNSVPVSSLDATAQLARIREYLGRHGLALNLDRHRDQAATWNKDLLELTLIHHASMRPLVFGSERKEKELKRHIRKELENLAVFYGLAR